MGRRGDRPYSDCHAYNGMTFHVKHAGPLAK
jgi:hypothetical protein